MQYIHTCFTRCFSHMFVKCIAMRLGPHRAAMSSSSPPQPQYWFGKPFILRYWSGVTADTPPKYCGYGSLQEDKGYSLHSLIHADTANFYRVLPISELVHSHGEVSGVLWVASVSIVVIFWKQVHIMEEDATPVFFLQSFPHTHVQ